MSSNVGQHAKTIPEERDEQLALTDRLPKHLREVVKHAPYNYAVRPLWDRWNSTSATDEDMALRVASIMNRYRAEEADRLYGPTHPQSYRYGQHAEA